MGSFAGTTRIGGKGIKKHFKRTEPWQAVVELVWNGFDAGAPRVAVELAHNDLDQLSAVIVTDDGDGIDFVHIDDNFGRFNESGKVEDVTLHGLNGRGRLAFHRLADRATWYTKYAGQEATIEVAATHLEQYTGAILDRGASHGMIAGTSGTKVLLDPVSNALPDTPDMLALLSTEFGWFLLLNPERRLVYDGHVVVAPAHSLFESPVSVEGHDFRVRIIRWHERPASEKSYVYLQNTSGKVVHFELSAHNNKPFFFASVYIGSRWADAFDSAPNLFNPDAATIDSKVWKAVSRLVVEKVRDVYEDFLREHVEHEIDRYEADGSFPDYSALAPADAAWRGKNVRHIVRSVYMADPRLLASLKKKQRTLLIRLLDRLSVSNENDALFDVLNSVLNLDGPTTARLAAQLERTTLDAIVETIGTLQRRQTTIDQIRELMRVHFKEVRETPDLQKIIELNTWLFGPQFETLGAEETTFTKIAQELRKRVKGIDTVVQKDVEDGATVKVSLRQPDLFLVRRRGHHDAFGRRLTKWVIIEIKRPGVALNHRHLQQLDEYTAIIEGHPEFSAAQTRVELILVGRKISATDTLIRSRLEQVAAQGIDGLIRKDSRFTVFVMNWETILSQFELNNGYLLEHLALKREELEGQGKAELLASLTSPSGEEAEAPGAPARRGRNARKSASTLH